mgnify:CR=1 FL=1
MYEIWLMLNIVWEYLLGLGPWLWSAVLLWLVMMVVALTSGGQWGRGLQRAIGLGLAVGVISFLIIPGTIGSSLSELRYWVDWAALAGMAVGFGGAAAVFSWPIMARASRA